MTTEETEEGTAPRVSINRQHRQVYRAQLEVAKAVRAATEAAGLERTLVELLNIRISQINGCAYCLHVHTREALAAGETARRLAVLPAWRDTTLFTAKERAALMLAESVTTLPAPRIQDQDYAEASRQLTAEELSAVSWLAIAINSFNRLSIVSRHPVRPEPGSGPAGKTQRTPDPKETPVTVAVRDNPEQNRYEIYDGTQLAGFSDYEVTGTTIAFTHTEVDPAFARRGLAAQLVTEALDDARRRGLAVLPFCPYVRKVIAKNAATYLELVPEKDRARFGFAEKGVG
ncbi:MAG TPA: GNAT family N-acetyltransferase [Marmoricola sp.]